MSKKVFDNNNNSLEKEGRSPTYELNNDSIDYMKDTVEETRFTKEQVRAFTESRE
eukprot:Pgem_evm1s10128